MSDAQATFTATLDSSGIQAGARSGLSAMERLGQSIQKRSKDLAALKGAQARLVQSAGVQEYLKRQKAIEKNEAFAVKAAKRVAEAQENVDIAKQANVSAEDMATLANAAESAKESLAQVKSELEGLQDAQDKLSSTDAGVRAFRDQAKVIKSTEAELADLQSQYNAAGGSATDLATEIKEPTQGIGKLLEQAKSAGGPLGSLASSIEGVATMAKSAGPLALVAVLIAIAAAAIKAAYALGQFVLASANAARIAARTRLNSAFGSVEGAKDISATMAALRDKTAASKEEAQALAGELYRLGDRGAQLEKTALTIERFGQAGEETKGAIKGLYEELRKPIGAVGIAGGVAKSMIITKDMLPRDVFLALAQQLGKDGNRALLQGFSANKDDIRNALEQIGETKFGDAVEAQMRDLDKLSERLHENISSIFGNVKVGVLLGALQKLVNILDESSESGKAIRESLTALTQPIVDLVESALPYIEAFAEGIILGALLVVLAVLKIKNALSGLIPDSFTKNIDWLEVTFYGAAGVVIALALAFGLLAISALTLALPFLLLVVSIVAIVVALVMALDYIVGWFDEVSEAFDGMDWGDIATAIIDGIADGLADGAQAIFDAMTKLGEGAYAAFKAAIKSKSPSVLFRMAGQTIPQGVALGVEDESDTVSDAVGNMTSPADLVAPRGNGGRSGAGPNINIAAGAIVINGANAESIEEQLERALASILRRAALSGGAQPEPETA